MMVVASSTRSNPSICASKNEVEAYEDLSEHFRGKHRLTINLDIRFNRLICIYNWWDGWPPNSRSKSLFSQQFNLLVSAGAPTGAPSKRWLPPDVVGHQVRLSFALVCQSNFS